MSSIRNRFISVFQPHAINTTLAAIALALVPLTTQAECNREEVGYIATFDVRPGSEEAFEKAVTDLAKTVMRVEKGVILYAPYKGDGGKYYMIERYQDAATRGAHGSSPEVRAKFGPLMATLRGQADIQMISAVCGG